MTRSFLLLSLLALLLLSGCSRGVESTATPTPPVVEATATVAASIIPEVTPTVTPTPDPLGEQQPAGPITVLYPALLPAETMATLVEGFNADIGEGIEVQTVPYSDSTALATALEGAAPSLLIVSAEGDPAPTEGVDLAPFIQSATWGMDDDAAEAQASAGAVTRFPIVNSVMALYYDPPLREKLDIELPTTWDELVAATCRTRDAERTGAILYPDMRLFAALIAANGGALSEGGTLSVDSEAAITAGEQLAALTAGRCALFTGRPYGNEPPPLSGPPLFAFGPLGQYPLAVLDPARPDPVAVAPLPTGSATTLTMPLYGRVTAPEGEGEALAAWLFLRWLRDPAQQGTLAEATGLLPVSADAPLPEDLALMADLVGADAPMLEPVSEAQRALIEEGLVQIMGGANVEQTLGYVAAALAALD